MNLSVTALSDPKHFACFKTDFDNFIAKNAPNPFLLSAFIERQMVSLPVGSIPLVLVFKVDGVIVGFVPLLIQKRLGISSAHFLFNFYFSPDFVFDDQNQRLCMDACLDLIYRRYSCKFVSFDLSVDSPNVSLLRKVCYGKSIWLRSKEYRNFDHAVLFVQSSWSDYLKLKNKEFRKAMRRTERRIMDAGKCDVLFFENRDNEQQVLRSIMDIEDRCWKKGWRTENSVRADTDLLNIWEGSSFEIRTCSELKRYVWLLSIDGKAVAYNLALVYKGTAYMCKTSFDNEYRQLYPGVFLNNVAIRYFFDSGNVNVIDFLTKLPFHQKWTKTSQSRARFFLSKGFVPKFFDFLLKGLQLAKITERFTFLDLFF